MTQTKDRRTFLKVLGGLGAAALASGPLFRALADPPPGAQNEFFVVIHAAGGWDVTLWSDPRNEVTGLIQPATTDFVDTSGLTQWRDRALPDGAGTSFELVRPMGSNITFGPAVGELPTIADRLCLINGIAMNTVSHGDGTAYSVTGRHLAGGRAVASSIDTMLADAMGPERLFPVMSVSFPSSFVGANLDPRVSPLLVGEVGTVARSLTRSSAYDTAEDRDAVTAVLTREAQDLASRAYHRGAFDNFAQQFESLRRMLGTNLQDTFNATALQTAYPAFNYRGAEQGRAAVNAAFAVEAMKRNVVTCVSFALGGLDTHNSNYQDHASNLQEIFNVITTMVRAMDATPHPTLSGERLSDHAHILVVSDFCRTPQINLAGGRDHYPNNSALVISPRFRGNFVFGGTDVEQLLPASERMFVDGMRSIAPPDVLATFLAAVGGDPRAYMRDGEVVRELLRS